MIKREVPVERRSKHLCLDAGYRGQPALEITMSDNDAALALNNARKKLFKDISAAMKKRA